MSKYFEFFKIDFLEGFHHRGAALGRVAFYGVILFVFSSLWFATGKSATLEMSPTMLVWYLGMTEILVLCYPLIHVEIEEDVRSGNLAYALLRPASYFWGRYFRGLGAVSARIILLISLGSVFVIAFSGGFPDKPWGLFLFLPLAFASVAVGLVYQVCIGICAFWIQESSPLYWVWQKLAFILGGMILPFEIYPEWLKSAAMYTPFPYLLYLPVRAVLSADLELAAHCVIALTGWFAVGMTVAFILFHYARKGLVLNGG